MKTTDKEIEKACKELDHSKFTIKIPIEIDALILMAVHGACCLGLRHPQFLGPSRKLVLQFVEAAERKMVEIGLIQQKHVDLIHKVEQEEREALKL